MTNSKGEVEPRTAARSEIAAPRQVPVPCGCTIVSNNYLAFARVLARSFREHHPGGRFWVLVADRPTPDVDYTAEPFEVVFAHELEIPAFDAFAFRHSILEFNTAVKPYFLEFLDRRFSPGAICYLDPDILILDDLGPIYRALLDADIVLTPHVTRPVTDDRRPGERELLQAGAYNLGFLGISFNPDTRALVRWWQEKLYLDCRHRVREGLFVDQRWMDLAPSLVARAHILRDPGYNVAYWNLIHRRLDLNHETGRWTVEGRPLRFYHFSGIDPKKPEIVSRHQDRYVLGDRPDIEPLFRRYIDLLEAAGHDDLLRIPYGFGSFTNGVPVPACAREALQTTDPTGSRWRHPFEVGGEDDFFDWLRNLAEGDPLPRIAHFLWRDREDLRQAFPRAGAGPGRDFARWLLESGAREGGLPKAFLESLEKNLEAAGEPRGDELEADASERDHAWLVGDAGLEPGSSPRVPRLAMQLRERRPDLVRAFPDPLGIDRRRFAIWYLTYGRREYALGSGLVDPVLGSIDRAGRLRVRLWWAFKGGRPLGA